MQLWKYQEIILTLYCHYRLQYTVYMYYPLFSIDYMIVVKSGSCFSWVFDPKISVAEPLYFHGVSICTGFLL